MILRSVNGIPLEKIKEAFEVMCKDSENYMSMGKAEFLEALAYKGIKCFGGLLVVFGGIWKGFLWFVDWVGGPEVGSTKLTLSELF